MLANVFVSSCFHLFVCLCSLLECVVGCFRCLVARVCVCLYNCCREVCLFVDLLGSLVGWLCIHLVVWVSSVLSRSVACSLVCVVERLRFCLSCHRIVGLRDCSCLVCACCSFVRLVVCWLGCTLMCSFARLRVCVLVCMYICVCSLACVVFVCWFVCL